MRLHTDTITESTVHDVMRRLTSAGHLKGVSAHTAFRGSRKRTRGFDLTLTAEPRKGRRRFTNSGYDGSSRDTYAATWDEWGLVLAALYEVDENLTGDYYADAEHYHWSTGERFDPSDLDRFVAHDNHRWEYQGQSIGRGYSVQECKCGAVKRHLTGGHGSKDGAFQKVFGRNYGERVA
jgi:hypothetical protein